MLLNIREIPIVPLSFHEKSTDRVNGTKIIKKLMGNPKGNPATGKYAPHT